MAVSPLSGSVDNVTVSVKIDGKPIDNKLIIQSIRVDREANEIASAELKFIIPINTGNGNPFFLSKKDVYAPGQDIEILAGYDDQEEKIFGGTILSQQIRGQSVEQSTLTLKCINKAIKLNNQQDNTYFKEKKDSEVITSLISDAGLRADVDATADQHDQLVKYQSTAWEFIISRAIENNLLVYTEDDKVFAKKPLAEGEADLVLTFGQDVLAFDHSYESSTVKKGHLTFIGNAKPRINTMIELAGFGKHYSGKVLITKISHEISEGYWQTSVGYGLTPENYDEQRMVRVPATGGTLTSINGLLPGIVKDIYTDTDGTPRVQVEIPIIASSGDGIWARLSNVYSTKSKGVFFMPEIGDEVVLGFFNDDPRQPVVLGSVYSSKLPAPYTADADNSIKAIVTKNDLKLEFSDKDKILTLETPAGNKFILSDKDKSITTQDQNGNKIVMADSGITISSAKDITMKAAGKIDITANQAISAKSSGGDISVQGLNVNLKAQVALSAQGSASAELKASGQTSVKGAMVMIN